MRALRRFAAVAFALAIFPAAPDRAPEAGASSHAVNANGWEFEIRNTPTDGLAIVRASFQGRRVFRRISIPQIRVFYSVFPTMNDQIGQEGSANVPLVPGSLKTGIDEKRIDVRARYQEGDWPNAGSYRYDVRYVFYSSGRFRPLVYAYGPGLEPTQRYEVDFRIDLDVHGKGRDFFQHFRAGRWTAPRRECRCNDQGSRSRGVEWVVFDGRTGTMLEVMPRQSDRRPSLWALRWKRGEGNTDLGTAFTGPGTFKDGDAIQFANVVLWYRSHAIYERPDGCPQTCRTPAKIGPTIRRATL